MLPVRFVPLLLLLAIAAAYCELPRHDFINLDDAIYVLENLKLREPFGVQSIARAFAAPYEHNWIPLTWTLAAPRLRALRSARRRLPGDQRAAARAGRRAALPGARPHDRRAGRRAPSSPSSSPCTRCTSSPWPGWRSARTCSARCLLLRAAPTCVYARRPGRGALPAGVALLLALGLLAKPMLVTLPFVLLLLDYWPLGRLRGRRRRARPARRARRPSRSCRSLRWRWRRASSRTGCSGRPGRWRRWTACRSAAARECRGVGRRLPRAELLARGPVRLLSLPAADPLERRRAVRARGSWSRSAVGAALTPAAPDAAVGWLWFLGHAGAGARPGAGGTPARADRYTYLPHIGLAIALAWGAADRPTRARASARRGSRRLARRLAALGVATFFQVRHWSDSERLWRRALALTTQGNFVAERGLADALVERGRAAEARDHYREAARLRPGWPEAELGLANVFAASGEVERALSIYRERLRRDPQDARATGALGLALLRIGRLEEARQALEAAQRLAPEKAVVQAGLGAVYQQQGRAREAVAAYRQALLSAPELNNAANNLAWLLATHPDPALRDPAEAVRPNARWRALSSAPDPALLDTLAAAYAAAGRFDEASARAEQASRLAERDAPELARAIALRAAGYRAGRAFVDAP